MMGERQSGKKKQSSKKNQKSRQIQSGRKEQATETKESIRVLGRVIRYMAVNYKLAVAAVLSCIILSAAATLKGMVFIQSLVDDYIRPLAKQLQWGIWRPIFHPWQRLCAGWQPFTSQAFWRPMHITESWLPKMVLHDIKMFAEPGQKIAFVGSTGAGKTTITNLINRFYDIQDGKIRYDGININKIKKPALRRSLGIVLQDTHLFTGTVMDNIRYGKLDATDEECVNAAKLANADSFINRLPDGYETVLTGDGGSLSQGQRQLLAIAGQRGRPARTDSRRGHLIHRYQNRVPGAGRHGRLMNGRTTFVIAHRLSTIRNSDCIMVMEQGRIIERGSHEELIGRKGKYYQLYTGNFEEAG